MKTKINKTKNIFEDTIESCIWINPYCAIYKHNIKFYKLYKHTFTRMFKKFLKINKPCGSITSITSMCEDESPDRDKKDDKDIILTSGHEIHNNLMRYDTTSASDYRSQI